MVNGKSYPVKTLDVPYEELDYDAGGINHMNWITKLERNNQDLYPEFRKMAKEHGIYKKADVPFYLRNEEVRDIRLR